MKQNFDGCLEISRGNIDRQHLRPPVLAILLETIERENFSSLVPNPSIFSLKILIHTLDSTSALLQCSLALVILLYSSMLNPSL